MTGRMKEQVHIQHICRPDHKAPPRPDTSRSHQCQILCQRQLLRRPQKVTRTSQNNSPFHYRRPVHCISVSTSYVPLLYLAFSLFFCSTTYQKCTVLTPTGEVHSRWKMLWLGAPSTAGAAEAKRRKKDWRCVRANGVLRKRESRADCVKRKPRPEVAIVVIGWRSEA